jgi:hypothetical protein
VVLNVTFSGLWTAFMLMFIVYPQIAFKSSEKP